VWGALFLQWMDVLFCTSKQKQQFTVIIKLGKAMTFFLIHISYCFRLKEYCHINPECLEAEDVMGYF